MAPRRLTRTLLDRWHRENGYRKVLAIAFPLILSTGSWSVKLFVDRMLLTWYSPEAVAASMPAGILNFALMSIFIGTAGYTNTFVAQYYGAGRYGRIGPAVWQGFYVALIGGVVLLALIPLAEPFFTFVGHDPAVREYETVYFRILCIGATPAIASAAMAGFFSGRGRTWPVMWVNVFGAAVNLVMDYALIFGNWGFPELGIRGAAIATVASSSVQLLAYIVLLSKVSHNRQYNTISGWKLERPLFLRLMRFGFPNGVQFFIDMMGLSVFILLMGRLGTIPLAASNIAFNVNTLAFMPMIGMGIAVSVLVGQSLGRNRPDLAERSVYSGVLLSLLYMTPLAALYAFVPDIFLKPFAAQADKESFEAIRIIAVVALRYIAVFSFFDAFGIIMSAAIKGAGDTRYVMFVIAIASSLVLVLPTYVALVLLNADVFAGWAILTAYVIVLGVAFLVRYLGGKWKSMRVIEKAVPVPASTPRRQPGMD